MYSNWLQLSLHQAKAIDVYKDAVRIHESNRNGIKAGTICRLYIKDGGSVPVVVRGLKDNEQLCVRLDEVTRAKLGIEKVKIGSLIVLRIRDGNLWDKIYWVLSASDPASRVSIWIAFLSLILGLVALGFEVWHPALNGIAAIFGSQ